MYHYNQDDYPHWCLAKKPGCLHLIRPSPDDYVYCVFFQNRSLALWWRRLLRLRKYTAVAIDSYADWLKVVKGRPVCAVLGMSDTGRVRIEYVEPD